MYKMLVKNTTTGQCGLADVPCAPEALTPMPPININGSVISLDMIAVAQALGFTDCAGNPVLTGAVVATCSDIVDAIAALPADKYLQGLQAYDAATNTLTLLMSDGTTVAVPMTALLADAWADVTPAQVAAKLGLLSCGGVAIPAGTQIATCADLNAAIAAIPSFTGVAANAPLAGNGTAASPLDVNFAALSAADIAALLTAMNLRTCAGALHTSGSTIPSCAEMNAAIAAAIAALPGDKFLQGLQSYNAATNVLTLLMNDGTVVPVDMTGLVNDAVASVVVVSADAGNLITAGTDGGALLTTVPAAPTFATGAGVPAGAPAAGDPLTYIDTSTTPHTEYYWDGAAWNLLGDRIDYNPDRVGSEWQENDNLAIAQPGGNDEKVDAEDYVKSLLNYGDDGNPQYVIWSQPNAYTLAPNVATRNEELVVDQTNMPLGFWNGASWTVTADQAGLWLFNARQNISGEENDRQFIFINGTNVFNVQSGSGVTFAVLEGSFLAKLETGDVVEFFQAHNSSGPRDSVVSKISAVRQ